MAIEQTGESAGYERDSARSLAAQRWRQVRRERRAGGGDGLDRSALESVFENLEDLDEQQMARLLGWFSVGLGLTEIAAPRRLAKLFGVRYRPVLFGFLGLREIASGVGILTQREPAGWVWSRVGGDMMDLALLRRAMKKHPEARGRLAAATAAVAGVTALDVACSRRLSREAGWYDGIRVGKSIQVNRAPEAAYCFWRNFENLPRFMFHLEEVKVIDGRRSRWVAKAPAGPRVEWDAEIVEDIPNELIAWRSLEGSDVENSGQVRFERAPGGRGTIVRVALEYLPPGGRLGAALARLFGKEPGEQAAEDLRRFKQLIEAGDIVTTEGQPAGRAKSTSWRYDRNARRDAYVNGRYQREARI